MRICVYARTHVGIHNGRPPFLCIVLFFFADALHSAYNCRDSRGDARKQCVIILRVVHTWLARARKHTTDVRRTRCRSVCVCAAVFLGATAQGYQWTVNESAVAARVEKTLNKKIMIIIIKKNATMINLPVYAVIIYYNIVICKQ